MHELFEEQAQRTPEAVAVRLGERAAELRGAGRAARIGWRTICAALGVGPDVLVGAVPGALGGDGGGAAGGPEGGRRVPAAGSGAIRRSGCAFMLEDARRAGGADAAARWWSGCRRLARGARAGRRGSTAIGEPEHDRRRARQCAENLAYVIYTSGSTGQPKGVCGHASGRWCSLVPDAAGVRWLGAESRGRCSSRRSASTRRSGRSVAAWCAAARLVIVRAGRAAEPDAGSVAIGAGGDHHADCAHRSALFSMAERRSSALRDVRSCVIAAASVAGPSSLRELLRAAPGCAAASTRYGPTEAHDRCRHCGVAGRGARRRPCRSAGRSPNTQVYVLDGSCSRCRWAWRASCTSAGPGWRAGTWTGRS